MNQQYQQFYRETGVRRFDNLLSPTVEVFRGFPRNSVCHYLTSETEELFPDPTKPFFSGYSKRIPVLMVSKSKEMDHALREVMFNPITHLRAFVNKNKDFRPASTPEDLLNDDRTLGLVNYNGLHSTYKYSETPIAQYQKWEDTQNSFWDGVGSLALKSEKQHFVVMSPFKDIIGFNLLSTLTERNDLFISRVFNTSEKKFLLHLARFILKSSKAESVLNKIPLNSLAYVNLLFLSKDYRCSTLNLGLLYSWFNDVTGIRGLSKSPERDPALVLKALLKYFMCLNEITHEVPEEPIYPSTTSPARNNREEENEEEEDEYGTRSKASNFVSSSSSKKGNEVQEIEKFKTNEELEKTDISTDIDAQLEEELAALDRKTSIDLADKGMVLDGSELKEATASVKPQKTMEEVLLEKRTPNQILLEKLESDFAKGNINPLVYKKSLSDIKKYNDMEDPYLEKKSVSERISVNPSDTLIKDEDIKLSDVETAVDKSMFESTLSVFTTGYLDSHYKNDIVKMVGALQKGGIIISGHEVEVQHSIMGSYETHTLDIKPIDGTASVLRFRLPLIDDNGSFKVANTKYQLRKQIVDLPIRKISPTTVGLSSYYGKCFVSTENKVADSTYKYVSKKILQTSLDKSGHISKIIPGDVYDPSRKLPYILSALSNDFIFIRAGGFEFRLDGVFPDEEKLVDVEEYFLPKSTKLTWCGLYHTEIGTKHHLFMDDNEELFAYVDGNISHKGNFVKAVGLNLSDVPVRFSELAVFRKNVSVGVILGYKLGLSALIGLLKAEYRIIEVGKRISIEDHEYAIPFADKVMVFSRKDKLTTLILGGFTDFEKITKTLQSSDFEQKDVYLNLLTSKGLGAVYTREIDMIFDYFVDPITEEVLLDMKEPTTFEGLLIRSSEMLLNYEHPATYDSDYTRIRGMERISGVVYKEFTTSIRQFRNKNIAGRSKVEISPYKVWQAIDQDPTKIIVPDINPIQDLKNEEGLTYGGEGGRTSKGMNRASRSFHANDVGLISEGTVDNASVGFNAYTSSSPGLKNYRGVKLKKDVKSANRHCSAVLLAPAAMHDDMNRVNFISVQSSHAIQAVGYHPAYVRTGFESVIPQRTTEMFAYCAKENGEIISLTAKGVVVKYESGKVIGVEIGRVFGKAEGSMFPYDIVSCVSLGQKVNKGDPIAYNTGFFEMDVWNPGKLVMKVSLTAKTLLWETKQTLEDASSVSKKLAARLQTRTTYERSFVVTFEQNVYNIPSIGDKLEPQTSLITIEDEITSNLSGFGELAMQTLSSLSKQSPKANYRGVLDKIEVLYHGDKESMSQTLRDLTETSDKKISITSKATNKPAFTGQVNSDYRVGGVPLGLNKAEVKFYITVDTMMGVADKLVFANQMKSVNSEVRDYDMFTETGEEIEAVFGCRSIANRNVLSPYILGTTITLLNLIAKKASTIYNQ